MNKYISIRNINVPEKVQTQLFAMPENLKIGCRLCSDGPIMTLFDANTDKLYGIAVNVKEEYYPICYAFEDSDAARALETALVNVLVSEFAQFLASEDTIFKTEDVREQLELHTDHFLCHVKRVLTEKHAEIYNSMCNKVAHEGPKVAHAKHKRMCNSKRHRKNRKTKINKN